MKKATKPSAAPKLAPKQPASKPLAAKPKVLAKSSVKPKATAKSSPKPKLREAQGQAELIQVVAQLAQSAEKLAQAAERFIEATLQKAQGSDQHNRTTEPPRYEAVDSAASQQRELDAPDLTAPEEAANFTAPSAEPEIFNPPEDE